MRAAAERLRELIRLNTLDKKFNLCDFDLTVAERKLRASPVKIKPKHG